MKVIEDEDEAGRSRATGAPEEEVADTLKQAIAPLLRAARLASCKVGQATFDVGRHQAHLRPRLVQVSPKGLQGNAPDVFAQRLRERQVWRHALAVVGGSGKHLPARSLGLRSELRQESRLADAGLASDQHDAARSPGGLFQPLPKQAELALTADQRRASAWIQHRQVLFLSQRIICGAWLLRRPL